MSEIQSKGAEEAPALNPLATFLKALGSLGDDSTAQGRAVKKLEGFLSGSAMKLAGNERFLSQMGRLMERGFIVRAQANRNMEESLHAMRIPTTNDIHEIGNIVQSVDDKIEAMGFQMEALMTKVERLEAALERAEAKAAPSKAGNAPAKARAASPRRATKG